MRTYLKSLSTGLTVAAITTIGLGTNQSPASDTIIVNEPGGYGVDQEVPTLMGTAHGALLLYQCDRTGTADYRLRSIDSYGNPRQASTAIEEILSPDGISDPILASNSTSDRTVLLWRTPYESTRHIVLIDSLTGLPIGESTVLLADDVNATSSFQETLIVADDGVCLFIYKSEDRIRGNLFDTDFSPLGRSFFIGEADDSNPPTAAFHTDGSFTVAWTGSLLPYFDQVRSQKYAANGSPMGPINNHTPDDSEVFSTRSPAVGTRTDGSSLVSWYWIDGLHVQTLDSDGNMVGEPQVVVPVESFSEDPGTIEATTSGDWILVQDGGSSYNDEVAFFVLAADDLATLYHEEINDVDRNSCAWLDSGQTLLVAWEMDELYDDADILGQAFEIDGSPPSSRTTLSDDVDGATQTNPRSDANPEGRSVIAWNDHRATQPQIYFQLLDEDGLPIGPNRFLAGSDAGVSTTQVSMNQSGAFAICWYQSVLDVRTVFVQRFNALGDADGSLITASEGDDTVWGGAHLELFDDGSMLVAWNSRDLNPSAHWDVRVRRFDSMGVSMTSSAPVVNPAMDLDSNDGVFDIVGRSDGAAWLFYTSNTTVRMREISALGYPDGFVQELHSGDYVWSQSATGDDDGFSVAWTTSYGEYLHVEHHDASAQLIASEILEETNDLESPTFTLAHDGTRVLLYNTPTWTTTGWIDDISYRRYDQAGTQLGDQMSIPSTGMDGSFLTSGVPAIAANDRLQFAYALPSGTDQGLEIMKTSVDLALCSNADFNCDGAVDGFDLARLLGFWGQDKADLNDDGTTDGADLTVLLGAWTG